MDLHVPTRKHTSSHYNLQSPKSQMWGESNSYEPLFMCFKLWLRAGAPQSFTGRYGSRVVSPSRCSAAVEMFSVVQHVQNCWTSGTNVEVKLSTLSIFIASVSLYVPFKSLSIVTLFCRRWLLLWLHIQTSHSQLQLQLSTDCLQEQSFPNCCYWTLQTFDRVPELCSLKTSLQKDFLLELAVWNSWV